MDYSQDKILRLQKVIEKTGKCRSGIYADIKVGRFPIQRKIGKRAVGWSYLEVQKYIQITLSGGEYQANEVRET